MKKINTRGEMRPYDGLKATLDYDWAKEWIAHLEPTGEPNLECDCGSREFRVCWWDYPFTGGYCKVICAKCQDELILIDDYA